jgi:hypothetical protein
MIPMGAETRPPTNPDIDFLTERRLSMCSRLICFLSVLGLLLAGDSARATYQFEFTDSSGVANNSFSVVQGSTVDIRIYLQQTGTDTGLTTSGLNSGGVGLTYNQAIASVTAITPNPTFNNNSFFIGTGTSANPSTLNVSQDVGGIVAATSGPDANRILLGTFRFTGVSAGTTLTLTVDPHSGIDDNVLANGTVLDGLIANASAAITVTTPVPEPGTLILTGLLGLGGAAGAAWRRYRLRAA